MRAAAPFIPVTQQSGCWNLPTAKAVLPTGNVSERAATRRTIFKKANKSSIMKNQTRSHNLKVVGSNPAPVTNLTAKFIVNTGVCRFYVRPLSLPTSTAVAQGVETAGDIFYLRPLP